MAEETSPKEISPKETSPKVTDSKTINPQEIVDFLKPRVGARFKTWLDICAHCALCADTCHFYNTSGKDPNMIPARKVRFLKEILKKRARSTKLTSRKFTTPFTMSVTCAGGAPCTAPSA